MVLLSFVPAAVAFPHAQVFSTLMELNDFLPKLNVFTIKKIKSSINQVPGSYRFAGGRPVGLSD